MNPRKPLLILVAVLLHFSTASAQCDVQKLLAPDGAGDDGFGTSLALDGDTLLVGAPWAGFAASTQGSVYVFERGPSGWAFAQELNGPFLPATSFGYSVAIDGDTAIVGNPGDDTGAPDSGSVTVFERVGTTWVETEVLRPADGTDLFGRNIALSGDTVLVGVRDDDDAGNQAGSAYVFERGPMGWSEVTELFASDAAAGDLFGASVALDGTTGIVGATNDDDDGFTSGSAYVFERGASGWAEVQKLTPADGAGNNYFGWSAAVEGDRAMIGALFGDGPVANQGSVYVFERGAGGWSETAELLAVGGQASDRFGDCIALDGDEVLVGAPEVLGGPAGSAYLFGVVGSEWAQLAHLAAFDASPNDDFGDAVAMAGDELVVGAPADDDLGFDSGSVHVLRAPATVSPFCFCASGAPCGNVDAGAGCASSTGHGGLLSACGTTSVSADDLVVQASRLRPDQFALVFMGGGTTLQTLGDGLRCTAGGGVGQFRFPVRFSGPAGIISEGPGLVDFSQSNFGASGAIAAFQTWYFQCWYRDPGGPCGANFNLTNGLEATFAP